MQPVRFKSWDFSSGESPYHLDSLDIKSLRPILHHFCMLTCWKSLFYIDLCIKIVRKLLRIQIWNQFYHDPNEKIMSRGVFKTFQIAAVEAGFQFQNSPHVVENGKSSYLRAMFLG